MSLRTVRHWDAGRNRVPWSVVRLLRLMRMGDLGALHDEWTGWTINRLGLHAPAGRTYRERDMRLWWMTCEHASLFRQRFELEHPEVQDSTQENRAGVQHLFGVPASRRTLPTGWGRRPERLEGASTFPAMGAIRSAGAIRETAAMVGRQGRRFPAQPAFSALPACEVAPAAPDAGTAAGAAGRRSGASHPWRDDVRSAGSFAGLVSSSKQVERAQSKTRWNRQLVGVYHAR